MPTRIAALILLAAPFYASAQAATENCMAVECAAGTRAVTYATKQEPYYACGSRELADYTNFVLGLVVMQKQLTGTMPNVSDKTGEPEYHGETKLMLDSLRKKAGVTSFDQAVSMCTKGLGKLKVVVLNNPKDSNAIYVATDSKKTFWLPKTSLDKK